MFIDALTYPIRQSAWIMILIGAVFSVILNALQSAPFVGIGAAVFSAGYFGAYYLDIVGSTMTGRDEAPDWPSFSSFGEDILLPFVRLFVIGLISFAPLIALVIFADDEAAWAEPAAIVAVVYACFYFPMAVLALQAFGSVGATLPHRVWPGIIRALPGYFLPVIALAVAFGACAAAQEFAARVPYIGWFVAAAIALYSLMFQGRLIGLIYNAKRERLGWD